MVRGRCLSVAPGLPSRDLARTAEHYRSLGFEPAYQTDGFQILRRDGLELHFALKSDHDPKRTAMWIYIRVEDADEMYQELKAAGAHDLREPRDTDYKMREVAYIDPDGNLILFGSNKTAPSGAQRG
jgi:catechol 2,3-dioxygenase-like lactoylglutathione lyase family enzyme